MSMTVLISDYKRYLKDGGSHPTVRSEDTKGRACKESEGDSLQVHVTGRSIWFKPFMGGGGEVRSVHHLYCSCENNPWESLRYGEPVYEDLLMRVE